MNQQATLQFPVIDVKSNFSYFTSDNLRGYISMADLSKPLFIASLPRKQQMFGVPRSSGIVFVPCLLDESRFKVSENYKIGLKPVDADGYCDQDYYLSDFATLVREGHIQLIDQNAPMIEPKTPSLLSRFAGWVYCKMTKFPCY